MPTQRFSNYAATRLASAINSTVTSFTVNAGTGALFPNILTVGDYFYCTITSVTGSVEIVKVTDRTADVFTCVRGVDGTVAQAFEADSSVGLRIVSATLEDMITTVENVKTEVSESISDINSSLDTITASIPGTSTSVASGVGYVATKEEVHLGKTDDSRAGAPAFVTPETVFEASLKGLRVQTVQDFNTYITPGVWIFEVGTHANGPTSGGILTVKVDSNDTDIAVRLTQTYEVWGTGGLADTGIMYTRGYHADSKVWSQWRSNSFSAPDVARNVVLSVPTVNSKYTMPYDGFICVQYLVNNISGQYAWLYVDDSALLGLTGDYSSGTNNVRNIVPVRKGSLVHCYGPFSLFQVFKPVGAI